MAFRMLLVFSKVAASSLWAHLEAGFVQNKKKKKSWLD